MFSEEFVDAATNEETLKFEKGIEESAKLDEEANLSMAIVITSVHSTDISDTMSVL